jgi:hypothetical protein
MSLKAAWLEARIGVLDQFKNARQNDEEVSNEDFETYIEIGLCFLRSAELTKILEVKTLKTQSTVSRWINKQSVPSERIKNIVANAIISELDKLSEKLKNNPASKPNPPVLS